MFSTVTSSGQVGEKTSYGGRKTGISQASGSLRPSSEGRYSCVPVRATGTFRQIRYPSGSLREMLSERRVPK